jgi:hypothetical protein
MNSQPISSIKDIRLMLFLHVLLFFALGTFTVGAPVYPVPVVPHLKVTWSGLHWVLHTLTHLPDFSPDPQAQKRAAGCWYSVYVSEHCSLCSRLICTVDLIYLDSVVRGHGVAISYILTLVAIWCFSGGRLIFPPCSKRIAFGNG